MQGRMCLFRLGIFKYSSFIYVNFKFVCFIFFLTFLISSPKYTAPEVFLNPSPSGVKVDSWSLGMIIAEQLLGQSIWPGIKLFQCLRKVLSLILCDTSIFERLARENNCYHIYEVWTCLCTL